MPTTQVNVIYCEDVREEVGGAQSYIGVVRGTVALPTFPAQFPKFAIVLEAMRPIDQRDGDLALKVIQTQDGAPDREIAAASIDFQLMEADAIGSADRFVSAIAVLLFHPLAISGPGTLKIVLSGAGELIEPGALAFVQAGEATNIPNRRPLNTAPSVPI